jgi:hypothetical protein
MNIKTIFDREWKCFLWFCIASYFIIIYGISSSTSVHSISELLIYGLMVTTVPVFIMIIGIVKIKKNWKYFLWSCIAIYILITFGVSVYATEYSIPEILLFGLMITTIPVGFIIMATIKLEMLKRDRRNGVYVVERPYENPLHRMPDIPPMNRERDWRITEQRQRRRYFS